MRPRAAFRQPWPLWDRLFYPLPALLIVAPFTADQLPLFLCARTRREGSFYAVASNLVFAVWLLLTPTPVGDWYVLLGCYAPALYLVLRRPNDGAIPPWLERRLASWPTWLRGRAPLKA